MTTAPPNDGMETLVALASPLPDASDKVPAAAPTAPADARKRNRHRWRPKADSPAEQANAPKPVAQVRRQGAPATNNP